MYVFQFSIKRSASDADKGNPRNAKAFKRVISPHAIGRYFVLSTFTSIDNNKLKELTTNKLPIHVTNTSQTVFKPITQYRSTTKHDIN